MLSVYPEDQAGTRLRAHQFVPHLAAAGVEVDFWSFLSLPDSRRWFGQLGRAGRLAVLLRSALRLLALPAAVRRADAVLVLREALPIASAAVERRIAKRVPLIWDVDDAIWTEYPRLFFRWVPRRLRLSADKYEQIARLATEVWAGSELLAQWCRERAGDVLVVPTVIEVSAAATASGASRQAVWVGSASTTEFLAPVLPALAEIDPPVALEVVGASDLPPTTLEVTRRDWSLEAEDQALAGARVGLYPIPLDHPLGPAKAGLKAILYMAHGLPCVVTPTPTVAGLVRDGVDGFHASTPQQWRDRVSQLLEDDALWRRMADAGRTRARQDFSLEAWGPRVAERVTAVAGRAA